MVIVMMMMMMMTTTTTTTTTTTRKPVNKAVLANEEQCIVGDPHQAVKRPGHGPTSHLIYHRG
jgi:hypothetical protein